MSQPFTPITVAQLPVCDMSTIGKAFVITDGDTPSDTTVGGGSDVVLAICNGADWIGEPLGDTGGSTSNSFETIDVPNGTNPVADSDTDTLTLLEGEGIEITGDSSADSVTITNTRPRLPALLNPPASPHASNDEFDTFSGWTWNVIGSTSTPVSGTVLPIASVSGDPIYDNTTWPGWLLVQSDESSGQEFRLTKSITLDTNCTILAHVLIPTQGPNFSAGSEGRMGLYLSNSGDSNELAYWIIGFDGSGGHEFEYGVNNNGSFTASDVVISSLGQYASHDLYVVIYKTGNDYRFYLFENNGGYTRLVATKTKTGVTTLDQIEFVFFTADETPSIIWGIDCLRYYASNTFALMNP